MLGALESALTKFDALAAKFEAGEAPTTVVARLLGEMRSDLGAEATSRRIQKVVETHVGREYAAWKASKRVQGQ